MTGKLEENEVYFTTKKAVDGAHLTIEPAHKRFFMKAPEKFEEDFKRVV